MRKKSIVLLAVFIFCAFDLIYANDNSHFRGLYPDIGMGIRAFGMGGAATAIANDPSGVLWNPAGLVQAETGTIDSMHTDLYEANVNYDSISGIFEFPRIGTTNIYLKRLDASSVLQFPYNEYTFGISKANEYFSTSLGKIQLGITAKILPVIIDADRYSFKAQGFGIDAGIIIRKGRLRFASVLKDPYTIIKGTKYFEGEVDGKISERISPKIVVGIGLVHSLSWRFAIDLEGVGGETVALHAGMEHMVNDDVAWRLGINDGALTAGFTVGLGQYSLNYGYQQGDFSNLHRFGLTFNL